MNFQEKREQVANEQLNDARQFLSDIYGINLSEDAAEYLRLCFIVATCKGFELGMDAQQQGE